MKKRPRVAVLNTVEAAGANLVSGAEGWSIVKTSAGKELLLGTFSFGTMKKVETFAPVAENQQVIAIGASATKDVIVASTRYKIEIGNPEDKYETHRRYPIVHAYTAPAVLSGDADTDRLNVNTALVNKVNAYAGNNCVAHLITEFDFTAGGLTGTDELPVGTTITQATSTETAIVGKIVLSGGSFAAGTAAGTIWVYNVSGTLTDGGVTWGWATSTLAHTSSTTVVGTGIAIVDDAGYFISNISRAGANWVGATQGWVNAVAETVEAAVYSMGIGSVMAQLTPTFDHSKQEVITGFLEYELQNGDTFDVAKTYDTIVITVQDGDEDSMGGEKQHTDSQVTLYGNAAESTEVAALVAAIGAL